MKKGELWCGSSAAQYLGVTPFLTCIKSIASTSVEELARVEDAHSARFGPYREDKFPRALPVLRCGYSWSPYPLG